MMIASPTDNLRALSQYTLCVLACIAFYGLCMVEAHAAGAIMCTIMSVEIFSGQLGAAIATVGVLMVAGGAALGRVSWTMAVTVSVGISCIPAAGAIAGMLGGGC